MRLGLDLRCKKFLSYVRDSEESEGSEESEDSEDSEG
jgi:hypothetical protein